MSDPFDNLFDGQEPLTPEQQRQPKKAGLVVGKTYTDAEFAERFVNRAWKPDDYSVEFEIENPDGSITKLGENEPTPTPTRSKW